MPRFRLFVLLLPVLLAPTPANPQGSAGQPFVDVIDVRVVNLEVVVVDGRGQRVSGLGPEDFRLRVDKREMPIDYFTEIFEGVAVAKQAALAAMSHFRLMRKNAAPVAKLIQCASHAR